MLGRRCWTPKLRKEKHRPISILGSNFALASMTGSVPLLSAPAGFISNLLSFYPRCHMVGICNPWSRIVEYYFLST